MKYRDRMEMCLVISSGRCGSTALSDALSLHPALGVLPEIFAMTGEEAFGRRSLDGRDFWRILSEPPLVQRTLCNHRIVPPEMRYPLGETSNPEARFTFESGVPPIAAVTLPAIGTHPDRLFDELEREVPAWRVAAISDQYLRLMRRLTRHRRPNVLIERSGGSLEYAAILNSWFPEAKVIHLYRDGRQCALSMRNHPMYRMAVIRRTLKKKMGADPYERTSQGRETMEIVLEGDWNGVLPWSFDRRRFERLQLPVEGFGFLWSAMVVKGLAALSSWTQRLDVNYFDLTTNTRATLATVEAFLEVGPDSDWLRKASNRLGVGGSNRPVTKTEQLGALDRACRIGMDALFGAARWE